MLRAVMARALCATLALLCAATLLAGCGESDVVPDRDGTLRLTLGEYTITPQNIKTRAGRIRIVARNEGRLAHDVVVEELVEGERAQPRVYGRTAVAAPGEEVREREPIFLEPGRYRILCDIANHDNLGQYGTLEVTR